MKTNFRFLALSAAILSMFTACQREELEQNQKPEAVTHSVTFVAGAPETKTTVDVSDGETAKFAWTDGDKNRISVYENGKVATKKECVLADGVMTIKATFEGSTTPENASYVAVVNSSNDCQIITSEAYDEGADILVSKAVSTFDGNNGVKLQFKREVAIAKMTLKGLDREEVIDLVTVSSTADIAGSYGVNGWASPAKTAIAIASESYMLDGTEGSYSIEANASGEAVVWFTCIPQKDATLTVKVKAADGDTYTKEFSQPITLTSGDVKAFGVAMVKDVVAAPEPVVLYCSDVTTSGYVSEATHVKNESLPFEYLHIMANGKNQPTGYGAGQLMQFKGKTSEKGEIYNTESLGFPVKYVEVYAQSLDAFYVYYGDSKAPSVNKISRPTNPTGTKTISIEDNLGNKDVEKEVNYYLLDLSSYNANYIRIVNGSSTNYFYKIVIRFDEPETVKVTGIELDKTKVTINKGEKTTLTATITPSDATNKNVTWSSSAEGVATVENGVVTAVAEGSATITVTTEDGNYTATCVVTVTAASTGGETLSDYKFATSQSTSNTAYTSNYDVTISDITWSVPGNQNFSGYVRIGGNNLSNTVRYIYSKTALPVGYKTITMSTNGKSNSALSVRSVVCKVYSSAEGAANGAESDLIATMTNTDSDWAVSTAKTIKFTDESSAAGSKRFYRFEFTLSKSSTSNKNYGIDLQTIVFSAN